MIWSKKYLYQNNFYTFGFTIEIDSGCYAALDSINKKNNDKLGLLSYFGSCSKLTTSINQVENKILLIKIYPNPSNGQFNIEWLSENMRYEVYDLSGKTLRRGIAEDAKISTNLKKEIYFLKLFNKKEDK